MDKVYFQSKGAEEFKFLSNYFRATFTEAITGITWPTVEHYYQAHKTEDPSDFVFIAASSTPKIARERGQKCKMRNGWDEMKESVMYEALILKFTQNDDLREMLLATDGFELVEFAPFDGYWGNGKDGNGKNRLGILLMQLRDAFKGEKR